MLLTVSKRLELSASRRVARQTLERGRKPGRVRPGNECALWQWAAITFAYFVFTGPSIQATGMLINISEIKERAGKFFAMVSITNF